MQTMQSAIKNSIFSTIRWQMVAILKKNIKVPSAQLFGQKLQFLY